MISQRQGKKIFLWVMLVLIVAAAAAVAAVLLWHGQPDTDSGEIVIFEADVEDVTEFSVLSKGVLLKLQRVDGKWVNSASPELPLAQDYVDALVQGFCSITAERELDASSEAYGLDSPKYTLSITAGKTTRTLLIGIQNSQTFDYYCLVKETGRVYMIGSLYVSAMSISSDDLTSVESLPSLISGDVYSLSVTRADGTVSVEYSDATLSRYDYSGEKHWLACDRGRYYAATTSNAVDFIDAFLSIDFSYIAQQDAIASDLAAYGLDAPYLTAVLVYNDRTGDEAAEATYTLLIGKITPDGYTPVMRKGSDTIYFALSEYVQELDEWLDTEMVAPEVFPVLMEVIQRFTITYGGKTESLVVVAGSKTDENGATSVTYDFRGNSVSYDSASVMSFYNALAALTYQAESADFAPTGDPVLQIVLGLDNSTYSSVKFSVYVYDESFYATVINGETPLLVNKRSIDEALKLMSFFW